MLLANIMKSIGALLAKRKKGQTGYMKSGMQAHLFHGHNSHYAGKKSPFARFRQIFRGQTRVSHTNYSNSVSTRKSSYKVAGLATAAVGVLMCLVIVISHLLPDDLERVPLFRVSTITYAGNDKITRDTLREASGIILHQTSLLGVDCAQVEAKLRAVPWVARAEVKKDWPATVKISIVENVPVALLHGTGLNGDQLEYMDKKGVPFLTVKPGAEIDYPVITGLTEIRDPEQRKKALAEVLILLEKIDGNNPQLPAQSVSEIHIDRNGELVVYLVDYPFPIFFGSNNTSKKYYRLVHVLKTLYKQKGNGSISQIEYIQMDYLDDKVLVAQNQSS